ncbi:globin domain-containing protein [Vogesella sp. LIG4]|uniref:globin domain-containing protein n=1 Tax=Vogesella sp. LIG4 TaxID=1192162 RepID=UPI00081FB390|nr:globin domain-containing protein [Vogesella sp. LIG4]SCK30773.1 nitric oxide dioxygenase [Vogesella sp. LIG4]
MNDTQIDLVQHAWDQLSYNRDQFTLDIYDALFRLDPGLRPMFNLPPERLSQNLGRTLNTILTSLHDLDSIRFVIIGLGVQHYRYGVKPEHFAVLKAALTEVLQQHLGAQLTPELAEAWSQAYDLIATLMQQGLAQAAQRQQSAD